MKKIIAAVVFSAFANIASATIAEPSTIFVTNSGIIFDANEFVAIDAPMNGFIRGNMPNGAYNYNTFDDATGDLFNQIIANETIQRNFFKSTTTNTWFNIKKINYILCQNGKTVISYSTAYTVIDKDCSTYNQVKARFTQQ